MPKAVRIWILTVLAGLTLLVRLVDISEVAVRGSHHAITLGFFWSVAENRMVIRQVPPTDFDGRPNPFNEAGLRAGDRLIEIRNAADQRFRIEGLYDFGDALRGVGRTSASTMVVERYEDGRRRQHLLNIEPGPGYGLRSWVVVWSWTLVFPLIAIGTGLFIGFKRPEDGNAFSAAMLLLCFSSHFGISYQSFPPLFRQLGAFYHALLLNFLPYFVMRFFLLFPSPSLIDRTVPALKHIGLVLACLVFGIQLYTTNLVGQSFALVESMELPDFLLDAFKILISLSPSMIFVGVASLFLNTFQSQSRAERLRMNVLLMGTLIGLTPTIVFRLWVESLGTFSWAMFAFAYATLLVFPLSFAYAVIRHRVMGVQLIIRQGVRYALVSRGFLVIELLVVFSLFSVTAAPVLARLFPDAWGFATAIGTAVCLAGVHALNKRVMPIIDRRFFREAYSAQQVLTDLGRDVRELARDPDRLLRTVRDRISDALLPDQTAVFVQGAERLGPDAASPVRFNPHETADYQCHWRKLRSRRDREADRSPIPRAHEADLQPLALPRDAFIPRYLERFVEDDSEALDVYLEDERSWARALALADPSNDRLYSERQLVERINTRLIVPLVTRGNVLGFISLGEKLSEEPYSREDKQLLMAVAEQTSIALDYAYLIEQVAEQEKLKRDLEIATEVQTNLLPRRLPAMNTLQYTGVCHPARGVGGDYYDFVTLEESRLCLALGDVSGKGISAALLMATLQALLRSHAKKNESDLSRVIVEINRLMCSSTQSHKYATFFCALYDDRTRLLTYVNAGHNPPMLFRPDDPSSPLLLGNGDSALTPAEIDSGQALRLETGGMVVGMFPQAAYQQETVRLHPGDVLVSFTDGVSEAMNEVEEEFGEQRIESLIRNNIELSAAELCQLVVDDVWRFAGSAPQHDDLTLVIAKAVG